jgi:hypothetical protein
MLSSVTRGGARSVPIAVGFGDEPSTCRFMASMSVPLPEVRATTVFRSERVRRGWLCRRPCARVGNLGVLSVIGRLRVTNVIVITATKESGRNAHCPRAAVNRFAWKEPPAGTVMRHPGPVWARN